jgi:hypothetical protein
MIFFPILYSPHMGEQGACLVGDLGPARQITLIPGYQNPTPVRFLFFHGK